MVTVVQPRKVGANEPPAHNLTSTQPQTMYHVEEVVRSTLFRVYGVVDPEHKYKVRWDLFVGALILYSCVVIPFRIAFDDSGASIGSAQTQHSGAPQESTAAIDIVDIAVDVMFGLDIIVNFFTAYSDPLAEVRMRACMCM